MGMEAIITVKNSGSAAEHINTQILEEFRQRVSRDLSGGGITGASATTITVEYVTGEPAEGQVEGAPADFSEAPEAAEEVKDSIEDETRPESEVRSDADLADGDTSSDDVRDKDDFGRDAEPVDPHTGNAVRADQGESPEALVHDAPNAPAGVNTDLTSEVVEPTEVTESGDSEEDATL